MHLKSKLRANPRLPKNGNTSINPSSQANRDISKTSGRLDLMLLVVFAVSTVAIVVTVVASRFGLALNAASAMGAIAIVLAATSVAFHSKLRTYSFATWVICFVAVGVLYPNAFLQMGPFQGVKSLSFLIQVAMFGMGATLTIGDFARIFKQPKSVAVGFVLQFSCMPILGWLVSTLMMLPAEIALGVILVGSCPGGVASNVITYLAKGNVALSVTMTACTTLAAPIMTPLMMYLLAGQSVPIDYVGMMQSIFLTVFVPVVAGLACNALLNHFRMATPFFEAYLAKLSMVAICIICGIIAANSAKDIQNAGLLLLIAVLLHNSIGYVLGYWGSRFVGCDEADSRTIAIEVGLQNGGMAAYLATTVIQRSAAAVAPALFAPVMNVTGSLLAAWWSRNRTPPTEAS